MAKTIKRSLLTVLNLIGDNPNTVNCDFENAPTFVAAQTGSNGYRYIDGTATGTSTYPGYWWATGNQGTSSSVNFDNTQSHSGSQSMHTKVVANGVAVEIRHNSQSGGYNTNSNEGFALAPNTQYTLSGWVKLANVTGDSNNGVQIAVMESDDTGNSYSTRGTGFIKVNSGWTQLSTTWTSDPRAVRGHIELRWYGHTGVGTLQGDAWFDDITLTPSVALGSLVKQTIRGFLASMNFIPNLLEVLHGNTLHLQTLNAVLSFQGTFKKKTSRTVKATLSFIGSFKKLIKKKLTASLSFFGLISNGFSAVFKKLLNLIFPQPAVISITLVQPPVISLSVTVPASFPITLTVPGSVNLSVSSQ